MSEEDKKESENQGKQRIKGTGLFSRIVRHKWGTLLLNGINFLMLALLLGFTSLYVKYIETPSFYFSKEIKEEIKTAVKNNAGLDIVNHIYSTRKIHQRGPLEILYPKENIYAEPTPLPIILNDILREAYTKKPDPEITIKISRILSLHNQVNPFDRLEPNQKFMFENIRVKLDSNYLKVQSDVNRIADEMTVKNALINEYLNKSNTGFWISIVALVLTIVIPLGQVALNRLTKTKA